MTPCTFCVELTPAIYECQCGSDCRVFGYEKHRRLVMNPARIVRDANDNQTNEGETK